MNNTMMIDQDETNNCTTTTTASAENNTNEIPSRRSRISTSWCGSFYFPSHPLQLGALRVFTVVSRRRSTLAPTTTARRCSTKEKAMKKTRITRTLAVAAVNDRVLNAQGPQSKVLL